MLGKEGLGNGGQVSQVGLNIYIYIYSEIYIYIYIFISLNKMADMTMLRFGETGSQNTVHYIILYTQLYISHITLKKKVDSKVYAFSNKKEVKKEKAALRQ